MKEGGGDTQWVFYELNYDPITTLQVLVTWREILVELQEDRKARSDGFGGSSTSG